MHNGVHSAYIYTFVDLLYTNIHTYAYKFEINTIKYMIFISLAHYIVSFLVVEKNAGTAVVVVVVIDPESSNFDSSNCLNCIKITRYVVTAENICRKIYVKYVSRTNKNFGWTAFYILSTMDLTTPFQQ